MTSCLDCGMELPDASYFCAFCGHTQSSTAMHPTRISRSLATRQHPCDVTMLLSDSSRIHPRRKEEDSEQYRPMAPPILLCAGQASSASVPMITGIPNSGDLPWLQNLLSRAALSCATAVKLALAPWIIITLTSVAILVGAGIVLPHLLGPMITSQVNASGNSHQHVIPLPMQPGQTDCLRAGNAHVHDVQIRFCTSRPGKASGNPSVPQQQGILFSNRSTSQTSAVLLPHVANGKLQTVVSSQVQRLLRLNTAVLSSTPRPLQTRSVLNKSVSTIHQVVRSVVKTTMRLPQVRSTLSKSVSTLHQVANSVAGTTTHLPQVQKVLNKSVSPVRQVVRSVVKTTTHLPQVGNTLNKSVSTVHQIVNNVVGTTTHLPQVQRILSKSVSTIHQVVRSVVKTTTRLPQVRSTLNKSVSTLHQVVNNVAGTTTHLPQVQKVLSKSVSTVHQVVRSNVVPTTHLPQVGNTLSKSVSTVHQVKQSTISTASQQPKAAQNTVSTASQQPKAVQKAVSTVTIQQQPKAVQNTVSTASQQSRVGNVLSKSTTTVHP